MQYTIKKGDSLSKIARDLTLDQSYYIAIANQNGISDPNVIYAGQVITIPDNWLKVKVSIPGATGVLPVTVPKVQPAKTGSSIGESFPSPLSTNGTSIAKTMPTNALLKKEIFGLDLTTWVLLGGAGIAAYFLLTSKK